MTPDLFPDAPGTPRVYALPPGVDFAAELLRGIDRRCAGWAPQDRARIEVYVNTERARRRLQALVEAAPVALPPRIRLLTGIAAEEPGLPPELPPLRRRLELARLVRALIAAAPETGTRTSAFALADGLAALLGEMQVEGVTFDAIAALDPPDEALHWQRGLQFLGLIRDVLEAPGEAAADPEHRLRLAMLRRAARWAAAPPAHPVIVAGSTGSRGATALFMQAVAGLPNGAVVLPGLDTDLPPAVWERLADAREAADHPQFPLARFCARLELDPAAVPRWTDALPPAPTRNALVSLAMRPAPVTDQWLRDGPALRPHLAQATAAVTLIEAADPQEEAEAIAIRLRRAVWEGRSAALVTPDRTLARRVTAALDRWRIRPDDSAGRPLDLTAPGGFLRLVAGLLAGPPDPVGLLAILKHPLCASSEGARGPHLGQVAALESHLRDCAGPVAEATALRAWAAGGNAARVVWAEWLAAALPAGRLPGEGPMSELVARHLALAERLAAGPGGPGAGALWLEAAGERALALMTELAGHADAGGAMSVAEYRAVLGQLAGGIDVPPEPFAVHPGVAIWGTLEARTQAAEVMILGGLDEGTWPRLPRPDPWLSRMMRDRAGLPLPERQIGLSAHDFQQAAGAPELVLSRAVRDGEAPTVPARWLLRLENLLEGLGEEGRAAREGMRARGRDLVGMVRRLDEGGNPSAAPRPAPVPPVAAFPAKLPVTQIENLSRDPYAVYARYVLGLRPLNPPRRVPDAMQRGIASHAVLEGFVARTRDAWPADAAALYSRTVAAVLEDTVPWPAIRKLWQVRLEAMAGWFLATEEERRATAAPLLLEAEGRTAVDGLALPFTLTARADRIDRTHGGALSIYDYKGNLPSRKQTEVFYRQLPLEAGIALRGGFPEAPATAIAELVLVGLGKCETRPLDAEPATLAQAWDELRRLIAAYQSGTLPFPARLRPQYCYEEGDYDHLARRGEWDEGAPYDPEPVA